MRMRTRTGQVFIGPLRVNPYNLNFVRSFSFKKKYHGIKKF